MSAVVDNAALAYARELKLDLVPLCKWDAKDEKGPRGKTPRDPNWLRLAYSRAQIDEWVKAGGNVGVRIRPSQLVIDVDPRNDDLGRTADQIVDDIELELGIDLSGFPRARTGSGGLHIFVRKPEDVRVRNTVPEFGRPVEFKAAGRQVVMAGSRHPDGGFYSWDSRGSIDACPDRLLELIKRPPPKPRELGPGEGASIEQIRQCLAQLDPKDYRDYEKWRNLLFSVHYACGGERDGLDVFKEWSLRDEEYADASGSIEFFWHYCVDDRDDAVTEASLFYEVLQAGGNIPHNSEQIIDDLDELEQPADPVETEPKPSLIFVRDKRGRIEHSKADNVVTGLAESGLKLHLDTFTLRESVLDPKGVIKKHFGIDAHRAELDDRMMNRLSVVLTREHRYWTGDPSKETIERAQSACEIRAHGVRDYLSSVKWDGVPRLETWLIENSDLQDSPYARGVSRLLLYGAVARVMSPGIKYDTMIILEGPQGGGKSKLIKWLGGQWSSEGLPSLTRSQEKDVVASMFGQWLIEVAELDSFKKADDEQLKAFISRTEDRVRLPFARKAQTFPRQCVLIGTTNQPEYLRDITGNRRYLPVFVGRIRIFKIPRDQLWAEAFHVWNTEPVPTEVALPKNLWGVAADMAEQKRSEDPWEHPIGEWLAKNAVNEVSTDGLVVDALHRSVRDMSTWDLRRLSGIMSAFGWARARIRAGDGRSVRGFVRRR